MSRRIRLYAGPIARLRYTATSSVAKFVGIGAFALVLIAAVIGTMPFVPSIYERVSADVSVAGDYIRDQFTVADTATPSKEDATQVKLRLEAGQYLRASEGCIAEAGIRGQRTYALTYAVSQLKEKLDATWLDVTAVTQARDAVTEGWEGITDEAVWEQPSCALIRPTTTAG